MSDPGRIRTLNPQSRNLIFYPVELPGQLQLQNYCKICTAQTCLLGLFVFLAHQTNYSLMKKINIAQKLSLFTEHWSPKIIAELNGQHIKLAKLKGEFVWHQHQNEDEMFLVIKGSLKIEFRDRIEHLKAGEMIVIPKGVEHKPIADEEVEVMLFEPKTTLNTGNSDDTTLTKSQLEVI